MWLGKSLRDSWNWLASCSTSPLQRAVRKWWTWSATKQSSEQTFRYYCSVLLSACFNSLFSVQPTDSEFIDRFVTCFRQALKFCKVRPAPSITVSAYHYNPSHFSVVPLLLHSWSTCVWKCCPHCLLWQRRQDKSFCSYWLKVASIRWTLLYLSRVFNLFSLSS